MTVKSNNLMRISIGGCAVSAFVSGICIGAFGMFITLKMATSIVELEPLYSAAAIRMVTNEFINEAHRLYSTVSPQAADEYLHKSILSMEVLRETHPNWEDEIMDSLKRLRENRQEMESSRQR